MYQTRGTRLLFLFFFPIRSIKKTWEVNSPRDPTRLCGDVVISRRYLTIEEKRSRVRRPIIIKRDSIRKRIYDKKKKKLITFRNGKPSIAQPTPCVDRGSCARQRYCPDCRFPTYFLVRTYESVFTICACISTFVNTRERTHTVHETETI